MDVDLIGAAPQSSASKGAFTWSSKDHINCRSVLPPSGSGIGSRAPPRPPVGVCHNSAISGRFHRVWCVRRRNADLRRPIISYNCRRPGRRRSRRLGTYRIGRCLWPAATSDFAGAYVQVRKGWALGDQGRGTLWLRNGKGVTMRLQTQRRGLQLSLGADGVIIAFK